MEGTATTSKNKISSFASFAQTIDARILKALADLGFSRPTPVQAATIPLALEGKDILGRAKTGSGKTAAYCIPLLQKLLTIKASDVSQQTRGLILVPTRELSEQVAKNIRDLLVYCDREVVVYNAASNVAPHSQLDSLSEPPDIIVSTPSRALALAQSTSVKFDSLETLVIDEADLILSYGNDEDVRHLLQDGHLPNVYQSFLMSATMTEEVKSLQGLVLRDPVTLELDELENEAETLAQYVVRTTEVDKFLLTYVMLRLKLIKGKCILFVNDVDRCYRLKLFLEQFSIKSCVLNSELPLNSRIHIVQEFNKGVYDYIIATDESAGVGDSSQSADLSKAAAATNEGDFMPAERPEAQNDHLNEEPETAESGSKKRKRAELTEQPSKKKSKRKHKGKDKEYGVTRGVDFIDVSCVLNFDLPISSRSYTHRVGRTARAGRTGMALSFVIPKLEYGKNKVVGSVSSTKEDEAVWDRIHGDQIARGCQVTTYNFDKSKIEAFRYRMEDALRSVTKTAIKEGRIKDLKGEVLKSDKLKAHFEDNPKDLDYLRHDKPLHPTRIQPHMKVVPKYLLPNMIQPGDAPQAANNASTGFVSFRNPKHNNRGKGRQRGGGNGGRKKKSDPLKKFTR